MACGSLDTYPDDVARLRETLPAIAADIARFTGLEQVLHWMNTRGRHSRARGMFGEPEVRLNR